jgi:rRNA maturation protein Rpf1
MITTSRYASENTRKLAKKLAGRLGTFYTSRGKKTIDSLVDYARKKGEEEIAVVEGNTVSVIEVSETGKWKWAEKLAVDEYEKRYRSKFSG